MIEALAGIMGASLGRGGGGGVGRYAIISTKVKKTLVNSINEHARSLSRGDDWILKSCMIGLLPSRCHRLHLIEADQLYV